MLGLRIIIFGYSTAVIICLMVPRCWSAAHYCGNGYLMKVDISYEPGQDEKLMPKVDAPSTPADGIRCTWEAAALKLDGTALVIVTSFNVSKLNSRRLVRRSIPESESSSSSNMYYQQLGPKVTCSGHTAVNPERVAIETFHVLQLPKGGYLSVKYESKSAVPDTELPPSLMMQLVEAGFCNREMVSFEHSCYLMSPRRLSLSAELARLNGDSKILQLASFHSLQEIRQFVEANRQRTVFVGGAMRSKVPLNLTEPVRIGLFYSRADKTIKFINSTGGLCLLQDVLDPEIIDTALTTDFAVACGSLRVDQSTDREVLEFRDCSEQLPALISFADSPRDACSNCSKVVLDWLRRLAVSDSTTLNQEVVPLVTSSGWIVILIASTISTALCIAVIATVSVIVVSRRRQTSRSSAPEKCSACHDIHMLPVASVQDSLLFDTEIEQSGDRMKKSKNNEIPWPTALLKEREAFSSMELKF